MFVEKQKAYQALIEKELQSLISQKKFAPKMFDAAIKYSLMAGGKRFRPILCLASYELVSGDESANQKSGLLRVAAALEMIHTYSLMQDDLPMMDNDELRRGRPTSHMIFGEVGALLASDALYGWALELIIQTAEENLSEVESYLKIYRLISEAAGAPGMLQGQWLDMSGEGRIPAHVTLSDQRIKAEEINDEQALKEIHRHKTGDLIEASLSVGAVLAGATEAEQNQLKEYGRWLGMCFQIVDDILDETSTAAELGKTPGKDLVEGKLTYPRVFGLEKSWQLAESATQQALTALAGFNQPAQEFLTELAQISLQRKN